jgi:hypothetical protein
MVHAMTPHALLHVPGSPHHATDQEVLSKTPKETCEMLFAATTKTADYHENMYGEKFEHWVKYNLLPTWHKMHRGNSVVLGLDTARYHHGGPHKL